MCKKILCAISICFAGAASADGQWTIGVLGGGATGVYVGEKDEAGFVPLLSYDTEKLHVGLDGLSYQVYDYGLGQVDVVLGYRGAPSFPTKNSLFDGLKRDDALELGISTQLDFGDIYLGLDTLTDITDAHGGTEADLTIGYVMAAGRFQLDAAVGARFRNDKLNQYLYGVSASESTSARSAFAAKNTTTGFANLTAAYAITENLAALAQISYEDIGNNRKSPLVAKSSSTGISLGMAWTF